MTATHEYKVIYIQDHMEIYDRTPAFDFEKVINGMASDGWRLVAVDEDRMYFERPVQS